MHACVKQNNVQIIKKTAIVTGNLFLIYISIYHWQVSNRIF